jgi:hypothetical protein
MSKTRLGIAPSCLAAAGAPVRASPSDSAWRRRCRREANEEDFAHVGFVVAIGILEEEDLGLSVHEHPALERHQTVRERQPVG